MDAINAIYDIVKEYEFKNNISQWLAEAMYRNVPNEILLPLLASTEELKLPIELDGLLIIACHKSNNDVIKKLVMMGANKNAKSNKSSTPLMFLAERNMIEPFRYFIEVLDADMDAKNNEGSDVEWYAGTNRSDAVLAYIKERQVFRSKTFADLAQKNKELEDKVNHLMEQMSKLHVMAPPIITTMVPMTVLQPPTVTTTTPSTSPPIITTTIPMTTTTPPTSPTSPNSPPISGRKKRARQSEPSDD